MTGQPFPRPDFRTRLEFFNAEQNAWKALSRTWWGLPPESLLRSGACGDGWSIKDVMNHTATWQEAALQSIAKLLAGQWVSLGLTTERFNAKHYALDKERSLEATRRRLLRSRTALLGTLRDVPAAKLLNPFGRQQIGWWAKYATYGHYAEHVAALQAFREHVLSKA